MSAPGHHSTVRSLIAAVVLFCAAPGSMSCVFAQDKGAPPWGEFLKRFNKDPLLKMPYHMDPEEGVKGLASKIRARELDIPNRKKAIRYLQDLDCVQFPEAKEMLLSLLNPEEEKWEEVRFEAAKGLRNMLARHSCNPDAAKGNGKGKDKDKGKDSGSGNCQSGNCQQASTCGSCNQDSAWQQCCQAASNVGKKARGERTKAQEPPCHCTSCCDADTLNKLAKTAYEMKENGCCYEPSLRVREMAVEAIKACGVPCHYKPYYGEFEEPGPPAWDETSGQMKSDGEAVPPATNEGTPAPAPSADSSSTPLSLPAVTSVATPISRLKNLCIVSLTHGQQVKPDPKISAAHRGRTYFFGSEEARQEFVSSPERFAIAFGGCDPVHYVETQRVVEGRFLAQHEGRYYMFATQENHQIFKSNPTRYSLKSDAQRVASSN